jgi:hypothetical protein
MNVQQQDLHQAQERLALPATIAQLVVQSNWPVPREATVKQALLSTRNAQWVLTVILMELQILQLV